MSDYPSLFLAAIACIIAFLVIWKTSEYAVESVLDLGKHFNINQFFIGTVVLGVIVVFPEIVILSLLSFDAAGGNENAAAMVFPTVLGSTIYDVTLALGISALIAQDKRGMKVSQDLERGDLGLMLTIMAIPLISILTDGLHQLEGVLLVACGLIYLWSKYLDKEMLEEVEEHVRWGKQTAAIVFAISMILMLIMGEVFVEGIHHIIEFIEEDQGYSEEEAFKLRLFVAMAVVGLASSVPEHIGIILASRKGHYDLVVGNLLGSAVLNISLALGIAIIIHPIELSPFLLGAAFILAFVTFLFAELIRDREITKIEGIILILICPLLMWAALEAPDALHHVVGILTAE
ncbi:MAG: sodium:calcium antiporter [Candidatus Hodarchaeota archaeon]